MGGIWFKAVAKWLFHHNHSDFLSHYFLISTLSTLPSFLYFNTRAHTNTHTNKAAEAARRELIQADRTQWHLWHFRVGLSFPGSLKGAWSGSGSQLSLWKLRGWGEDNEECCLAPISCQGTEGCERKTSTCVLRLDMQSVEESCLFFTCYKQLVSNTYVK